MLICNFADKCQKECIHKMPHEQKEICLEEIGACFEGQIALCIEYLEPVMAEQNNLEDMNETTEQPVEQASSSN